MTSQKHDTSAIGQRLQQARIKASISQAKAAAALGVSHAVLSYIEHGRTPVTRSDVQILLELYGTSFSALVPPGEEGNLAATRRTPSRATTIERVEEEADVLEHRNGLLVDTYQSIAHVRRSYRALEDCVFARGTEKERVRKRLENLVSVCLWALNSIEEESIEEKS